MTVAALILSASACGSSASPSVGSFGSASPRPTGTPTTTPTPAIPLSHLAGHLVFARAGGQYGDETLFIARADGSDERRLSPLGGACCVRVSPDGKRILYSIQTSRDDRIRAGIKDIVTGRDRVLPLPDKTLNMGAGAWSPDGERVALQAWDPQDHRRDGIYTVRASDGSDRTRVTDAEIADLPADWAPDGKHLLVFRESQTQSVGRLFVVDLATRELTPLTPEDMDIGYGTARYSPDGQTIVFQEARTSATGALWTIRPDGSGMTKLFEDPAGRFASHPAWSPDGTMILFALNPVADDFEHLPNVICVIDANGSNLRLVLGGNNFKREPALVT